MKLYRVEMVYNGWCLNRSTSSVCVFRADNDIDAEAFARFLAADWTESTVTLAKYTPTEVPSGYAWGDTSPGLVATIGELAQWEQTGNL